jgi:hypothetical protein
MVQAHNSQHTLRGHARACRRRGSRRPHRAATHPESTLYQYFGRQLIDRNVEILDPAAGTGTGTCLVELIEHFRRRVVTGKDGTGTLARAALPAAKHTSLSSSVAACDPGAPHDAGAGGAHSRAISDRMSANLGRGTATSAIWKLT